MVCCIFAEQETLNFVPTIVNFCRCLGYSVFPDRLGHRRSSLVLRGFVGFAMVVGGRASRWRPVTSLRVIDDDLIAEILLASGRQ